MSRSSTASQLGQRIDAAIVARGTDTETVARAVGMPVVEFESRLRSGDISMPDIVRVGGFLRMAPTDLFGVAA
ncbi:hypothetical protein HP467_07445 [Curtobacterium albidum]|uniref:DNA-binding protein n=1 Tax=Curtobacterium citreum TaxID=2036 RepID=A0A850DTZ3_9MICO|nr:hypothetical protein [Curtobacterium albidum]NUU27945.1 hypothetical protein [Curtobacterium albidum]